jgi:hypothetical protein
MNAKGKFFPKKFTIKIFAGNQGRTFERVRVAFVIGEMQPAPKVYHNTGFQLCR